MTLTRTLACTLLVLPLAACDGSLFGSANPGDKNPATGNHAPVISGQPPAVATVNKPFYFRPNAYDPDGDVLVFEAVQLPTWARLNVATGEITGTPPVAAAGTTTRIAITVTDGEMKTSLPGFTVTIAAASEPAPAPTTPATATLSWTAPTRNEDGSSLTDLAGYRIHYGSSPGTLTRQLEITDPAATGTTVTDLTTGTWYFAISSINTAGVESRVSQPVSVVLQ